MEFQKNTFAIWWTIAGGDYRRERKAGLCKEGSDCDGQTQVSDWAL